MTTEPSGSSRAGRRSSAVSAGRRRVPASLVLAVALPLLTGLALLGVRTSTPDQPAEEPTLSDLTRVTLACPPAADVSTRTVTVGSALAAADGRVAVDLLGAESETRTLDLRVGRVTSARLAGAAVVTGEGGWAPGLLAARFGARSGVACQSPAPQAWFTGVGARPQHASVLELVNPDPGPAIADIAVLAPGGTLDVPALRGVRVAGRSSTTLDLAEIVPRRTELSVQVVVSRGRLTSTVRDTVDTLGAGPSASDWVTAQAEPVTSGLLLGLPAGEGSRRLTLANGGTDETRVDVRVVSPQSVFAPGDLEEIRIPPGSSRSVELDAVLAPEVEAGATGLLVEASHPVTAGLSSFVDGDLTHTVAVPVFERAATLLPAGAKRLVLAGAERPGVATLVTRSATGQELSSRRVEIGPDRSVTVRLPAVAAYVEVELSRTPAVGAVLVEGAGGAVVVPLRETLRNGVVPAVRPRLP
jgi:Family of unknown function (DUF5719)